MAQIIDEVRFDFEDEGYLEVRKLKGEEIDSERPLDFNTDMEFISTNADELKKLGEFLISMSEQL